MCTRLPVARIFHPPPLHASELRHSRDGSRSMLLKKNRRKHTGFQLRSPTRAGYRVGIKCIEIFLQKISSRSLLLFFEQNESFKERKDYKSKLVSVINLRTERIERIIRVNVNNRQSRNTSVDYIIQFCYNLFEKRFPRTRVIIHDNLHSMRTLRVTCFSVSHYWLG